MNLRSMVFEALGNALENGYTEFLEKPNDVLARDLYDCDADIAEALGVQAEHPPWHLLIPYIEEWKANA